MADDGEQRGLTPRPGQGPRITYLGSRVVAPRPPARPALPEASDPPEPGAEPDADADLAGGPRFPVIIAAAPGLVLGFFAAAADKLIPSLGSVPAAMGAGGLAAAGSIACFAIIAAHSREQESRMLSALFISLALLAYGFALIRMI